MRRSLFLLGLGVISGIIATVLLFTFDDAFRNGAPESAGGGNARLSLDEDALAAIVESGMAGMRGPGSRVAARVSVRTNGEIEIGVVFDGPPTGPHGAVTVNPEIRDGTLIVLVVADHLGEAGDSVDIARLFESALIARLQSLAGNSSYRLTFITTADGRLTLAIEM